MTDDLPDYTKPVERLQRQAIPLGLDPASPQMLAFALQGIKQWLSARQSIVEDHPNPAARTEHLRNLIARVKIDYRRHNETVLLAQKRFERLAKYAKRSKEKGMEPLSEMQLDEQLENALHLWKTAHGIALDVASITGEEVKLSEPPEVIEE